MESLIPIINQLQDICNDVKITLPIDLPQIIVVGAQSSGKSSVIESIVKREFLPRGSGIVTRRPLVIRLFKVDDDGGDWVKFKHLEQKFTNFDEVRQEIERETESLCGVNQGISSEPITLSVYSKNVVNLTLVDLPGLTKIPVGDQPQDIEIQIIELVKKYISNPNSIILAVTAANTDITTSESIKLARDIDPEGKRTLAVLTKLDSMDQGTDALDILTGKHGIKIRLGAIGVVNRSQQEIINKKPLKKALEDEANFLQRRYPAIADRNGQPYLSKRLSQLLMRHIRDCLPDLKLRINSLITQYEAQLNSYGDPVTDKARTIIGVINKFSLSYCNIIEGGKKRQIRATELCGGARIQYIFYDSFGRALSAINPLENLDNKAILTVARNAAGMRNAINTQDVFEVLVTDQIKRLEGPSLRCVDLVHEEMGRFVKHCGDEVQIELLRFPKLREKIEEILTLLLNERLPKTRKLVKKLVECETACIDFEHPRLRESYYTTYHEPSIRASGDNKSNQNGVSNGTVAVIDDINLRHERELRECDAIARKINAYFNSIREEIKVLVPRAITCSMVNHITSNLHSALIEEVYKQELFDTLLSESDDIARRRTETAEMLTALKRAEEVINAIHYQK